MAEGNLPRRGCGRQARHDQALQARLAAWNHVRFALGMPRGDWRAGLEADFEMRLIEAAFVEACRSEHADRAADAPQTPQGFVRWFEALKHYGPGQGDPLFPWLAEHASFEQIRWFVEQEAAGEAGFDDLVAMAQIKAPTQAKLELARNYWDEMGRGNAKGMHGPMLEGLVRAIDARPAIETTIAPSLALGNTMAALAANRAYSYQALGALGVIELTAPTRAGFVSAGLERLKVSAQARHYFDLHAVLDLRHSEAWNREIFASIVAATPDAARHIAEGALMRLQCGADCFGAYRLHFWGGDGAAAPA